MSTAIRKSAAGSEIMITAKPAKNIPYLDGWRGIAIILVLLNHFVFIKKSLARII